MIDEKKLLEERPEWLNPNRIGKEEYHKGWNECNKYWCNTIKSQPKVDEWIPVSEMLPKEAESVILTVKDDSADSPIYYTSVGWYYNGIWIVENTVCYQVTAWMPLPEPYKEGE